MSSQQQHHPHRRVLPWMVMTFSVFWMIITVSILPVQSFSFNNKDLCYNVFRIQKQHYSSTKSQHALLLSPQNQQQQQQKLSLMRAKKSDDGYDGLGEYDPSEGITPQREVVVGNPQLRVKEKERSVTSILKELAAIQQQGPQKYCILGTRHCSYLHQQIIELLYVSVLYYVLFYLTPTAISHEHLPLSLSLFGSNIFLISINTIYTVHML
jgi:hypothetical protein